jgi:hypothetical protein
VRDHISLWFRKILAGLIVIEFCLLAIAELFRHITGVQVIVGFMLASAVSYIIYIHRHPGRATPRSGSSGERTPIMPRRSR